MESDDSVTEILEVPGQFQKPHEIFISEQADWSFENGVKEETDPLCLEEEEDCENVEGGEDQSVPWQPEIKEDPTEPPSADLLPSDFTVKQEKESSDLSSNDSFGASAVPHVKEESSDLPSNDSIGASAVPPVKEEFPSVIAGRRPAVLRPPRRTRLAARAPSESVGPLAGGVARLSRSVGHCRAHRSEELRPYRAADVTEPRGPSVLPLVGRMPVTASVTVDGRVGEERVPGADNLSPVALQRLPEASSAVDVIDDDLLLSLSPRQLWARLQGYYPQVEVLRLMRKRRALKRRYHWQNSHTRQLQQRRDLELTNRSLVAELQRLKYELERFAGPDLDLQPDCTADDTTALRVVRDPSAAGCESGGASDAEDSCEVPFDCMSKCHRGDKRLPSLPPTAVCDCPKDNLPRPQNERRQSWEQTPQSKCSSSATSPGDYLSEDALVLLPKREFMKKLKSYSQEERARLRRRRRTLQNRLNSKVYRDRKQQHCQVLDVTNRKLVAKLRHLKVELARITRECELALNPDGVTKAGSTSVMMDTVPVMGAKIVVEVDCPKLLPHCPGEEQLPIRTDSVSPGTCGTVRPLQHLNELSSSYLQKNAFVDSAQVTVSVVETAKMSENDVCAEVVHLERRRQNSKNCAYTKNARQKRPQLVRERLHQLLLHRQEVPSTPQKATSTVNTAEDTVGDKALNLASVCEGGRKLDSYRHEEVVHLKQKQCELKTYSCTRNTRSKQLRRHRQLEVDTEKWVTEQPVSTSLVSPACPLSPSPPQYIASTVVTDRDVITPLSVSNLDQKLQSFSRMELSRLKQKWRIAQDCDTVGSESCRRPEVDSEREVLVRSPESDSSAPVEIRHQRPEQHCELQLPVAQNATPTVPFAEDILSDDALVSLSMSELNEKLLGYPPEQVEHLKRKRKRLQARRYRSRRKRMQHDLGVELSQVQDLAHLLSDLTSEEREQVPSPCAEERDASHLDLQSCTPNCDNMICCGKRMRMCGRLEGDSEVPVPVRLMCGGSVSLVLQKNLPRLLHNGLGPLVPEHDTSASSTAYTSVSAARTSPSTDDVIEDDTQSLQMKSEFVKEENSFPPEWQSPQNCDEVQNCACEQLRQHEDDEVGGENRILVQMLQAPPISSTVHQSPQRLHDSSQQVPCGVSTALSTEDAFSDDKLQDYPPNAVLLRRKCHTRQSQEIEVPSEDGVSVQPVSTSPTSQHSHRPQRRKHRGKTPRPQKTAPSICSTKNTLACQLSMSERDAKVGSYSCEEVGHLQQNQLKADSEVPVPVQPTCTSSVSPVLQQNRPRLLCNGLGPLVPEHDTSASSTAYTVSSVSAAYTSSSTDNVIEDDTQSLQVKCEIVKEENSFPPEWQSLQNCDEAQNCACERLRPNEDNEVGGENRILVQMLHAPPLSSAVHQSPQRLHDSSQQVPCSTSTALSTEGAFSDDKLQDYPPNAVLLRRKCHTRQSQEIEVPSEDGVSVQPVSASPTSRHSHRPQRRRRRGKTPRPQKAAPAISSTKNTLACRLSMSERDAKVGSYSCEEVGHLQQNRLKADSEVPVPVRPTCTSSVSPVLEQNRPRLLCNGLGPLVQEHDTSASSTAYTVSSVSAAYTTSSTDDVIEDDTQSLQMKCEIVKEENSFPPEEIVYPEQNWQSPQNGDDLRNCVSEGLRRHEEDEVGGENQILVQMLHAPPISSAAHQSPQRLHDLSPQLLCGASTAPSTEDAFSGDTLVSQSQSELDDKLQGHPPEAVQRRRKCHTSQIQGLGVPSEDRVSLQPVDTVPASPTSRHSHRPQRRHRRGKTPRPQKAAPAISSTKNTLACRLAMSEGDANIGSYSCEEVGQKQREVKDCVYTQNAHRRRKRQHRVLAVGSEERLSSKPVNVSYFSADCPPRQEHHAGVSSRLRRRTSKNVTGEDIIKDHILELPSESEVSQKPQCYPHKEMKHLKQRRRKPKNCGYTRNTRSKRHRELEVASEEQPLDTGLLAPAVDDSVLATSELDKEWQSYPREEVLHLQQKGCTLEDRSLRNSERFDGFEVEGEEKVPVRSPDCSSGAPAENHHRPQQLQLPGPQETTASKEDIISDDALVSMTMHELLDKLTGYPPEEVARLKMKRHRLKKCIHRRSYTQKRMQKHEEHVTELNKKLQTYPRQDKRDTVDSIISDDALLSLSMSELNEKLVGYPPEKVAYLKKKRRRLQNNSSAKLRRLQKRRDSKSSCRNRAQPKDVEEEQVALQQLSSGSPAVHQDNLLQQRDKHYELPEQLQTTSATDSVPTDGTLVPLSTCELDVKLCGNPRVELVRLEPKWLTSKNRDYTNCRSKWIRQCGQPKYDSEEPVPVQTPDADLASPVQQHRRRPRRELAHLPPRHSTSSPSSAPATYNASTADVVIEDESLSSQSKCELDEQVHGYLLEGSVQTVPPNCDYTQDYLGKRLRHDARDEVGGENWTPEQVLRTPAIPPAAQHRHSSPRRQCEVAPQLPCSASGAPSTEDVSLLPHEQGAVHLGHKLQVLHGCNYTQNRTDKLPEQSRVLEGSSDEPSPVALPRFPPDLPHCEYCQRPHREVERRPSSAASPAGDILDDDTLVSLSIPALNRKLNRLPVEEAKRLRRKRRTLLNRRYAKVCRNKRVWLLQTIEAANDVLGAKLRRFKADLARVTQERDLYRECLARRLLLAAPEMSPPDAPTTSPPAPEPDTDL